MSRTKVEIAANIKKAEEVQDIVDTDESMQDLIEMAARYDMKVMRPFKNGSSRIQFIDTKEAFLECVATLSKERVIGVDLENNSQISYNGFTCLI